MRNLFDLSRWAIPSQLLLLILVQADSLYGQSTSNAADMVCSPSLGCIAGKVTSQGTPFVAGLLSIHMANWLHSFAAGVRLSSSTPSSNTTSSPQSVLLLPGTYTSSSLSLSNGTLLQPFLVNSSISTSSYTGFSVSGSSSAVSVSEASGLIAYSNSLFAGTSSLLPFNASFIQNATSTFTPLSFLLSPNMYAVANVPISGGTSQRIVFWSGTPDVTESPMQVANGQWTITDLQASTCSPACASGGVCSLQGQCACADGFTGSTCSKCQHVQNIHGY